MKTSRLPTGIDFTRNHSLHRLISIGSSRRPGSDFNGMGEKEMKLILRIMVLDLDGAFEPTTVSRLRRSDHSPVLGVHQTMCLTRRAALDAAYSGTFSTRGKTAEQDRSAKNPRVIALPSNSRSLK